MGSAIETHSSGKRGIAVPPEKDRRAAVPLRYLLAFCLFVLSAVAFLDRTNISIAGLQISREFLLNNEQLSWLFTAFLIGYVAFQIPAGLLARRLGARRALGLALVWWSVTTALTAVVPNGYRGALLTLAAIRFVLGAGEAMMYPAASQFVERWFPLEERGKVNGLIFAGVGIGSGITPPLVTAIILHYSWRASFWFSASIALVVGMAWYIVARDTPERHPFVSALELHRIVSGRDSSPEATLERTRTAGTERVVPWIRIFRSRVVLALTVSYFAFGYVAWIFFAWFFIYLAQVRGLNLKSSALYSMLPFLGMTVGCLSGGVASDWLVRHRGLRTGRCLLPAAAMALTSVFMVVGSSAAKAETASIVLACGAGILYVAQSCFWAVSADFAGEYTSVVSGIMNMGAQIGGACTASLTPLIAAHFGWKTSFFAAALLALVGALAWLAVEPSRGLMGQT
ncbi:MAG: MFS transporter [Acidobacteriaceae bacterium]